MNSDLDKWIKGSDDFIRVSDDKGSAYNLFLRDRVCRIISQKYYRLGLDVGCGTGHLTNYMSDFCDRCLGIDPVEKFIETAKSRYDGVDFETCELTDIHDTNYDLIICINVINNLENIDLFFRHASALLDPKGKLIISVEHPFWTSKKIPTKTSVSNYQSGFEYSSFFLGEDRPINGYHRSFDRLFNVFENSKLKVQKLHEVVIDKHNGNERLVENMWEPIFAIMELGHKNN